MVPTLKEHYSLVTETQRQTNKQVSTMQSHREIAFEFSSQPWLHIKVKLNILQLKV